MDDWSWTIPAGKAGLELYEKRETILGLKDRLMARWRGEPRSVVFTGQRGAGKSVLFDFITGAGYERGYTPPARSQTVEEGKIKAPKRRISLAVIPGQTSNPRHVAIEDHFMEAPISGIIHVTAFGYSTLRNEVAREKLIKESGVTTIAAYRALQLRDELEDLGKTCEIIRRAYQEHHKPMWMIVAATKVDLYYPYVEDAKRYYSPHGDSEFTNRMTELSGQIGTDNFTWDAVPVCSWLESFEWNGEIQRPELDQPQRDYYMDTFVRLLTESCRV